jgi:hemolysin III
MLSVVWTLAGLGMLLKVFRPDTPRWVGVGLYLGLGWVGIVAMPAIVTTMSVAAIAVLALGGAFYSIGAVVYARRWPDPSPRVFGYHEVFHALVIAGSVTHFALVAGYVL